MNPDFVDTRPADPVRAFNARNVRTYKRDGEDSTRDARAILRGLHARGMRILAHKRSPHGSDCDCREEHLEGPMGSCRCVRVLRARVDGSGDWLLVWGDLAEGGAFQLQGPYHHDSALSYGGGFWKWVTL